MPLFQCDICGCCENTSLASQGFPKMFHKTYDWSYAPERKGMKLCSACGPVKYRDGAPTPFGKWHNEFERVFLPLGKFHTNSDSKFVHIDNGDPDYMAYALPAPDTQ